MSARKDIVIAENADEKRSGNAHRDEPMLPDLLTLTQAAKSLGVSRQRVHALIKEGRLPAVKVGPYWLIEAAAVAAYQPLATGRPKKYV